MKLIWIPEVANATGEKKKWVPKVLLEPCVPMLYEKEI